MNDPKTVELSAGTVVDERYRVSGRLGQGGMGTVYEAEQVKLQRAVALKVLRPEFAEKDKAVKRFEREARAASSIEHRNVVSILDFGHLPTGELYYTMEMLHGRDLSQVLREGGALPWSRAGWIILQVVRAFGAIHAQGIVHRDIKPANCFLMDPRPGDEPDFVKILDFGIANLQDERTKATALTGEADIIGSVRYMAPEQITSEEIDARTDIYSLGVMMYELLTGQVPFADASIYQVMIAHQQQPPRPPRELMPELPPEAEALILRALAKAPAERFQSMQEIETALLPLVEIPGTLGGSTAPRLTGASMRALPPGRSGMPRWLLPVIASVLFFVVAILVTRWIKNRGEDDTLASVDDAGAQQQPDQPEQTPGAEGESDEANPTKSSIILPPPEQQYDPFADPFGAPSLSGRTLRRAPGGAEGEGETEGLPAEEIPLEELLPPEPWTLEEGTLKGIVRNDKERPLGKASVCAWIIDPRAPAELRKRPVCGRTDRRGRFSLSPVVPGVHDVHVFKDRFLPQSYLAVNQYPVALQPGETQSGLEFTLEPGGVELQGTVKSKLGDPIRGAKVAVVGGPRALGVADASGRFKLWVAQPEISVVAWANGYTDVVAKGRSDAPLAVVLTVQAKIIGQVIDADTREPVAGARVRAGRQGPGLDPLAYTNESGEFTISGLSAGRYQPTARTDDAYGQLAEPQRLSEGTATSEVIIKIRRFRVETPEPEPEPVVAGSTGELEGSTGDTDGTGTTGTTGTTGDELAGSTTGGDDAEDDLVVIDDDGASEEEQPDAPAVVEPKPKLPTDRSLRAKLGKRLRKCGTDGTIEVNAKLVLASGELLQETVKIKGAAAKDPNVRKCAEGHLKRFKLTRRKEPTTFKPLVVTL